MQTNVHVVRPVGDAVVVRLEVHLKHLVRVLAIIAQALQHVVRAKVRQRRVVNLQVPQTLAVQRLELLAVGCRQVRKELLIVLVDVGVVALALRQTQMEVARRRHGELALSPLLFRHARPQELPVVKVRALLVADLALADGGHGVLLAGLLQSRNGCGRETCQIPWHGRYLLEALKLLEEAGEVVFPVELSRADCAHIVLLLRLNNGGDGLLLSFPKLLLRDLACVGLLLRFSDVRRANQGANVVGVEGKLGDSHFRGGIWNGGVIEKSYRKQMYALALSPKTFMTLQSYGTCYNALACGYFSAC